MAKTKLVPDTAWKVGQMDLGPERETQKDLDSWVGSLLFFVLFFFLGSPPSRMQWLFVELNLNF